MSATTDRPTFDLLDPYLYQDAERMHAAFTRMRANEPVYRDHRNGLWGITRHGDLKEVEALVTELLDQVVASGRMEVVDSLSGQLPARLTCRLIGYPESMWREVKSAQVDGQPLPPRAMVHEVGLFISGGGETTRTAIGHGLRAFVDHPEQWEAMAADPSLVPDAVEEVLRWVTPLNNMFRRAAADDRIGGQPVGRGDRIIMLYPSANRDEAVFDDPFTFDIRRSPNPQISFGYGTHLCVGTHVARTTLAAVFGQLSQRITDLRAGGEPDVEPNSFARAVRSFQLGFSAR